MSTRNWFGRPVTPESKRRSTKKTIKKPTKRSKTRTTETLEDRQMMAACIAAAQISQTIYLDFDGAQTVNYNGPVSVQGLETPAFSAAPAGAEASTTATISDIVSRLNARFADQGVIFVAERPAGEAPYSTIYVGGTDAPFAQYGAFFGLSEHNDPGNLDPQDEALVFSDSIARAGYQGDDYVAAVTYVIAHETSRLIGLYDDSVKTGDGTGALSHVAYEVGVGHLGHSWASLQAYLLFEREFGETILADYLGSSVPQGSSYAQIMADSRYTLAQKLAEVEMFARPYGAGESPSFLQGTHQEDSGDNPTMHFWDYGTHGVNEDFVRDWTDDDGLLLFNANPNRAYQVLTGADNIDQTPGMGFEGFVGTLQGAEFEHLGHAAHLLQDLSLPAHSHADQHFAIPAGMLGVNVNAIPVDPDALHEWADATAAHRWSAWTSDRTAATFATRSPAQLVQELQARIEENVGILSIDRANGVVITSVPHGLKTGSAVRLTGSGIVVQRPLEEGLPVEYAARPDSVFFARVLSDTTFALYFTAHGAHIADAEESLKFASRSNVPSLVYRNGELWKSMKNLAGIDPDALNAKDFRTQFAALYLEMASTADDHDTRSKLADEYDGQFDGGTKRASMGFPGQALTTDQTNLMNAEADRAIGEAIRGSAELIRLYYGDVDNRKPVFKSATVGRDGAFSKYNSDQPLEHLSKRIVLKATVEDQAPLPNAISGVGKMGLQLRVKLPDGSWSTWMDWAGKVNVQRTGRGKANLSATFEGQAGKTYDFRFVAEDGAGNQADPVGTAVHISQNADLFAQIIAALTGGAESIGNLSDTVVNQAAGEDIPFVRQSVAEAVGAGAQWREPFQRADLGTSVNVASVPAGVSALSASAMFSAALAAEGEADSGGDELPVDLEDLEAILRRYFTVEYLDVIPQAGTNDLLRITWNPRLQSAPATLEVGGSTGFSYFDDGVTGHLEGSLRATAPTLSFQLTLGVDLLNGQPRFFVGDSTRLAYSGLSATGHVSGALGLRNLASVSAQGTLSVNASASLGLQDLDADHKLRVEDFRDHLGQILVADVDASIRLENLQFKAELPLLPTLAWSGSWSAEIVNGRLAGANEQLFEPAAIDVLRGVADGFVKFKTQYPLLGQFADTLGRQMPVINKSLGSVLGIDKYLDWLTEKAAAAGQTYDHIVKSLEEDLSGDFYTFDVQFQPSDIPRLIRGEQVDLVRFDVAKDFNTHEELFRETIFSLGIPEILSVNAEVAAYLDYGFGFDVGMGIDTHGVWIKDHSGIHLYGKIGGDLEGNAKILGLKIASVGGGMNIGLQADVGIYDPSPGDGKVHLSEIYTGDLADDILNAFGASLSGTFGLHAYAEANLLFFTLRKDWNKEWTIFRVEKKPSFPGRPNPNGPPVDPPAPPAAVREGVLYLSGTEKGDKVQLSGGQDGAVTVAWEGYKTTAFQGVREVRFDGAAGSDRLAADDHFPLKITALGGEGNDELQGGDLADELDGGAGDDKLYGRGGDDRLAGGPDAVAQDASDRDTIWGGDGNDRIQGGADDDQIFAGWGNDVVYAGAGFDLLDGDRGDDQLYGEGGDDILNGEDGQDTLDGGEGGDLLDGGIGADSLSGGAGDDQLIGGDQDDVLVGGQGDDVLWGDGGNDQLYGDDIGETFIGNDLMSGGDGNDLLRGGQGNDMLLGDDGNDALDGGDGGDNLQGGWGDDVLTGG